MPCTKFEMRCGGVAIICSRGSKPRKPCEACGQRVWSKLCDYALAGKKKGKTCDKKVCDACAVNVGPDRDLCPVHAKLVHETKVPAEMLADPEPFAMRVVADLVEQKTAESPPSAKEEVASFERLVITFKPRDLAD